MIFTPELLTKAVPDMPLARSRKWVDPLNHALTEGNITTRLAVCAFLAQVGHESGSFYYTKELGGPSYFKKYEGRKDLGNVKPGDGIKYPGRGLIQVTGVFNTLACSKALFGDARLLDNPELLEEPKNAALSAVWYWNSRGITRIANIPDFELVTRKVNGGLNGYEDRQERYKRALDVIQ